DSEMIHVTEVSKQNTSNNVKTVNPENYYLDPDHDYSSGESKAPVDKTVQEYTAHIKELKERFSLSEKDVFLSVMTEKKDDTRVPKSIVEEVLSIKDNTQINDFQAAVPEYTKSKVCVGVELEFEAFTMDNDIEFEWNFGDGNISSAAKPTHTYYQPGEYHVNLTSRSKSNPNLVKEHP